MKSNKWFTRILIAVVLGVWGLIFYRIISGITAGDEVRPITGGKAKTAYFNMKDHADDVVNLDLNYRDPFTENVPEPKIITHKQQTAPAIIPQPSQPVWPEVRYMGYIYNGEQKRKVAILEFNGSSIMLGEGQSRDELKVLKLAGDSVKLQFKKMTKFISIR